MLPDPDHLAEMCLLAVKTATAPLLTRIQVLEQRAAVVPKDGRDGEKGEPGKDADPSMILELKTQIETLRSEQLSTKSLEASPDLVRELVRAEVATLPPAPAGKDGEPGAPGPSVDPSVVETMVAVTMGQAVPPMVAEAVQKAVAAIPPAKDGEKGEPGASVDLDVVEAFVEAHVTKAIAAVPPPKDGTSVTVDDVAPLIASEVQKAFTAIPDTVDADDVQTLDALFRKELGLIAPRVPRVQKRIVRDAAGKIERVIDEPLN